MFLHIAPSTMKTQRRSEDSLAKQEQSPIQSTMYELLII